jgi:two-component system nitrate/nitrite response regulator NarL
MNEEIKVMLVDDHTLFRKGLAELLDGRDTIRVAATTVSPRTARWMASTTSSGSMSLSR